MPRLEAETGRVKWYKSDGAKSVCASLLSILIGLAVGTLVVIIVGLVKDNISMKGIWDGIRLVFLGVFSTGRDGGQLSFGYNPVNLGNMLFRATPLVMTGLSVAVAFKTGLFNIGAAGQYLMGTMGSISVGLWLGWSGCPSWLAWLCAFIVGIALGALSVQLDALETDVFLHQRLRQQGNGLGQKAVEPLPGVVLRDGELFHERLRNLIKGRIILPRATACVNSEK